MIHLDIGITAMNMNTDTQHLAYVLLPNETSPPQGLLDGLKTANRLQDMVRKEMKVGRTGDEVFWAVRGDMDKEGLEGRIYSHPIGDYGHSAGAAIGMADWQTCKLSPAFAPRADH
jgi:Xaa-Pro aminopeptidase